MARPLLPFDPAPSGSALLSIPANDNALRAEVIGAAAIGFQATQPTLTSPADDGKLYVLSAAWGAEPINTLALFRAGSWSFWTPYNGLLKRIGASAFFQFNTGANTWDSYSPGASTQGRHAIYVSAAGMRPSVTGGCSALNAIASAANQPDIVTLDFDPTTQEYAQFSLVMPRKWNEGTITFIPHWSHATTTVNFGVVWGLQAVAVSNDDPIAVAFGTEQTSTDTGGTTNDYYAGPESAAITIAGTPQPEDMVFFRVNRNPAAGSDTMAIDARLHGITVYVTTNADTDA
jgi:hypothetical protein